MSKIVIKKKVSFDFLGEEYKDAYINFRSIPISDYDAIQNKIKQLEKEGKGYLEFIQTTLKKYFIDGKFPVEGNLESLDETDLEGLDAEAVLKCFTRLTGQDLDPKDKSPSTTPSTTDSTTTK